MILFIALPSGQWHSTCSDRIPSHIAVTCHSALVSYEVQRMTCYGCNDTGHIY